MARKKRRRSPEVLRRTYGGRARTLEEAILSLPPRPPPSQSECECGGRRCLGCGGSSHLLRPEDSSDYRLLLTGAFCVVSGEAPPLRGDYLCHGSTQRTLVRNVIELIKGNSQVPRNVLCNGYDQQSRFSFIAESLSTSTWDLLLARIGDASMVFLLKFSSIFIPSTNKNYHQVTGIPLDTLIKNPKFLCSKSESRNKRSCFGNNIHHGAWASGGGRSV